MVAKHSYLDTDTRRRHLTHIARLLGLLILGVGVSVMLGWWIPIPLFAHLHTTFGSMKFNTALLFALAGLAVFTLPADNRYKKIIPYSIALIAGLTLLQYLFGWNLGIDQFFVADTVTLNAAAGRMSLISAINFMLIAVSLISLPKQPRLSQLCAYFVGISELIVLVGYLYNVPALYRVLTVSTVALLTAFTFLLMAVALVLANTESYFMRILSSESAGARLMRQVLPVTLVLLIATDTLFVLGEKAGLYQHEFIMPLNVVASLVTVIVVISSFANQWHETDLRRMVAEEQIRQTNAMLEHLVQERTAEISLYKTAVEASSEQIIIVDRDYRFLAVNDAYLQYRPYGQAAVIGQPLREIIGATLFDNTLQPMFARALKGEKINFETTIDYPTLGTRHVLANYSPLSDTANQIIGVVAIIHDITERKQMELALRENEHKLQTLFEVLPDGVSLLNNDMQVVQINPMLERILGVSEADLLAGNHYKVRTIHADGSPMLPDELPSMRAIREQKPVFDVEIGVVKADGKTTWTLVNAAPLDVADLSAVVVSRDITHRKQVERALEASMEYLSLLTHAMADGIMTVDLKTRNIQFVNQRFCEIFGYDEEELIGQPTRIFYDDDEPHAAFGAALQAAISTGKLPLITERELRRKDGQRLWTSTATSTLTLNGQVTEAISIVRDITERKQLETQSRQVEVEQEHVRHLREFITNVSHDLKTPITQIITSLYILKRTLTNDDQQERIAKMEVHTNNLRIIIDAMVKMTELDAKESFEFACGDGNMLLADLMTVFAPLAAQKQQQFTLHAPEKFWLNADMQYLHLALSRIIENAINYTPVGGAVTITVHRYPGEYVIEIKDTGVGIAPEDLPRIFERFYRADKARSIGDGHTGMGLAITRKIIQAHHGRIEVTSQVNVGSTFCVYLPTAD